MAKKENDEVIKLEREIKELKSLNRSLQRQLKTRERKYKPEQDQDEIIKEDYEMKTKCQKCGKGKKQLVDLGPRQLITCTVCDYRETLKQNVKKEEV